MLAFKGLGLELFTVEQIEAIHSATMRVLEETGIRVSGSEALELFGDAGCFVDRSTNMVRIPRNVVEDAIRSSPSKVLLAARDPKYDVVLEKGKTYFGAGGLCVKIVDPRTGRRRDSTIEDVRNIARVIDALEEVCCGAAVVTPHDVPEHLRSLYMTEAVLCNTAKHVVGGGRAARKMAAAILGGMDKLRERPIISASTCPHSPLTLHDDTTETLIAAAKAGIPVTVETAALAGGTAPVTLAGALVITNAEVLSGITLVQLVRRGSPVIYASSTAMLDLMHATAIGGAPESALVSCGVAQLGHYYDIPTMVGGCGADSKLPDAQAGHESTLTALLPALAGASQVCGMGEGESALTFSFTQLLMDAEFVRMIKAALRGIEVNEETLAVDVIKKVGAGKNYLAEPHTVRLMGREQSRARLIDRRMRQAWERKGGKTMAERAEEEALALLESHKPVPLDPAIQTAIQDIVQDSAEEWTAELEATRKG